MDLYPTLAAAFARGKLRRPGLDDAAAIRLGREAGLRIHRFKRRALPRVERVIGVLRGLAPTSVLDVGSGRGTFLWPLLDAMPGLPVTAIDRAVHRVRDVAAARAGGVPGLATAVGSVDGLGFRDGAFDVTTVLEVLEHLERPEVAAREVVRVSRRFVVASVPSKADENPEHLRLFSPTDLRTLFLEAGARDVQVQHVLDHRIAVIKL